MASARATAPQSWNRYSYAQNKPTTLIDPSGLSARSADGGCSAEFGNCDEEETGNQQEKDYEARLQHTYNAMAATRAAHNGDWDTFNELMAEDSTLVAVPQEATLITGPYVFPEVADNAQTYVGKTKTTYCATWVQQVAEKQGKPLGLATNWYAGEQVNSSTKRGTAIMSGLDKNGYYKNDPKYNHAGFYLFPVPGGFAMLENIRGNVKIRFVTGTGDYFRGSDQYFVIMVQVRVEAGIGGYRRP